MQSTMPLATCMQDHNGMSIMPVHAMRLHAARNVHSCTSLLTSSAQCSTCAVEGWLGFALVCIVKAALVSPIMCTLDGVQSLLLLSHILK